MIERSFDSDRINELINHPTIRPHIGGDGISSVDTTSAVADRQNFFLLGRHGGFSFSWAGPKAYEIHTFILPEGRGREAYRLVREAVDFMAATGALHIWTRILPDAVNVRRFALSAGFKPAGKHTIDMGLGPVTYDLFEWRA